MTNLSRIRRLSPPRWAGTLVFLLGLLSLAGWTFKIHPRIGLAGLVAMKANTAICFTVTGLALMVQTDRRSGQPRHAHLARALAAIVLVVAGMTLAEYVFDLDLDIDQLLFRESPQEAGISFPGRMAPASALNFVLLSLALFLLDVPANPRRHWPAQDLVLACLAITLLAFVAYFYGVEIPRRLAPYVTIALHTLIGFTLLGLGILFARPERGVVGVLLPNRPGSMVARRLLPAAILFPLLVGWMSILAERAGFFGLGFGTALFALSLILAFTSLVIWSSHGLNRTDAQREKIQEELLASREQLRALAGRLQAAREQERASLAREIHDTMAQELTRLKLDIAWLDRRLTDVPHNLDPKPLRDKLKSMREITDISIRNAQRVATDLRPVVLDTLGLYAAIQWQVRDFETRAGIRCETFLPEESPELEPERSTAIFRILQESLTNIARHARATKVEVCLHLTADTVSLTVRDNGAGIADQKLDDPRSIGLIGMRERAALLDGACLFLVSPQGGTSVEVVLPCGSSKHSHTKHP